MKPIQTIEGRTAAQVARSVEDAVAAGDLRAGEHLPSIRALGEDLDLANGTVARAYRLLRDRGVVVTDGRRGTRVRARSVVSPRQSIGLVIPDGAADLSSGEPDPALLPDLGPHLAAAAGAGGLYGEDPSPHLHPGLRDALMARAARHDVPTDHLAVTSGALDGVERVLEVHLRPGDVVAVEDPGWPNLLDLVAALGLRSMPLTIDDQGPTPTALADARERADAVVVTSRSQNPTGAAVSEERQAHAAAILHGWDGLVVEDDHGGEASGVPLCSLAGTTSRWALVQSLSKSWGPDLRVAALFGDASTVARVAGRFRLGPGWVSRLLQHVAWSVLVDDGAQATVAAAAVELGARRDRLVGELAEAGVAIAAPSGLNVWIPVPDEGAVMSGLLARGWGVAPGARYRQSSGPGIRVTAAALDGPAAADRFARDLAAVMAGPATGV